MAAARTLPTIDRMKAGAPLVVANAVRLLADAEALASRGTYGFAASTAVLAWEDAVKARLLMGKVFADRLGRPFGVDDKNLIALLTRSHELRHKMGFIQALSTADRVAFVYGFGPLTAERKAELQAALDDDLAANAQKQQGMYVDFDQEADVWRTPEQVTEIACREWIEKIRAFVTDTQCQLTDFAQL